MHSLVDTDAEPLPVEVHPHPSDRVIVASLLTSVPPGWFSQPTEPGRSLTIEPRPIKREVLVHSWDGACTPEFVAHISSLGAHLESEPSDAGKSSEPRVSRQRNVLIWNLVGADGEVHRLRCLADTGAQVDLLDAQVVARLGLPLRRLLAPLHLKLGTEGNEDRVPFYTTADFSSGHLSFRARGFFVGNVQGYDAILGLPFIEDAKVLVGNGRVSCFAPPPSVSVSDLGTLAGADLAALRYTE